MIRGRRFLPSPALVVACLALLLALGGTAYAQFKLPRNSVSSIHVRDRSLLARDFASNSVSSVHVRDKSLLAKDFARNVLRRGPAGPTGPQGPQGPTGAAGPAGPAGQSGASALKWALFTKDGQILNQNSDIRFVSKPIGGSFIINTGAAARGKAIMVTSSFAGGDTVARGTASASPCGGPPEGITCPVNNDINHVWVFTYNSAGVPEDHAFYLAILG